MTPHQEKRRAVRSRHSDAMLWRPLDGGNVHMGWLLEQSTDGLAFAWRGGTPPAPGTLIEVYEDGHRWFQQRKRAVVRRASTCHEDLCVIAAQVVWTRSFPPETAAASAELKLEPNAPAPAPFAG